MTDFNDIPYSETFVKIEPINKGFSEDKKYYIETIDSKRLLLRISDISEYARKRTEFEMLQRASGLGIPVSLPIAFGTFNGGLSVCTLLGWCDGEDAETLLTVLSDTEQYILGLKAGEILRKIHSVPAPEDAEPFGSRFRRRLRERIAYYNEHPIDSASVSLIINYLLENQSLTECRPQTFTHGDFNFSNLIVSPGGDISLIDFNGFNTAYGDPWMEFSGLAWGEEPKACFYSGLVSGYFKGVPPSGFFDLLMYYIAYDALAAACDADPETGVRHAANVLRWFDNMKNPVPSWYLGGLAVKGGGE